MHFTQDCRHYFADKGPSSQSYGFPVVMYGCESWTIEKAESRRIDDFDLWCWRRLLSPLDCKEIKRVNSKRNQSSIFIGRTDAEAETPTLWPSDAKSQLIRKDPGAGKDWRQEEKGATEDAIVGWHHWLNGHDFEQTLGDGDGQGSLGCCSPWDRKELDTTELLNTTTIWELSLFDRWDAAWFMNLLIRAIRSSHLLSWILFINRIEREIHTLMSREDK